MSLLPVALILVSCFAHAGWNLLARRGRSELAFFRRMLLTTVPIGLGVIGFASLFPHSLPPRAMWCVAGSGTICGFYYWFLGRAYGSSDFTMVYPVARASPVLIVALLDMLRGRYPTGAGWLGLVMVVGGCALAPQVSYRAFDWRHYGTRAVLWVLLTAGTIVGFTMLDKIGSEAVLPGPASAAIYCALFHIISCVSYLVIHAAVEQGPTGVEKLGWRLPALAGALSFASYVLVLWAFQMAEQTSYLLALRQFSIVIGVVGAFRFYRERGLLVRVPAALAIVAGLVLVVARG